MMNYYFGILLGKYNARKTILSICILKLIIINLFKYANFIINNLNYFSTIIGLNYEISMPAIHLPIGISFFTFQAVSYVIDVYCKETDIQRNPFDLALYISLFPTCCVTYC